VPRRLTIEWFPGTSTLTWTCVCCGTLAVRPSVRDIDPAGQQFGRQVFEYSEPSGRRSALAVPAGFPLTWPHLAAEEKLGVIVAVDVIHASLTRT
jgi:hypothetical protein